MAAAALVEAALVGDRWTLWNTLAMLCLLNTEVHQELAIFGIAMPLGMGFEGTKGLSDVEGAVAGRRAWPVVLGGCGWRWRSPRWPPRRTHDHVAGVGAWTAAGLEVSGSVVY